MKAGDADVTLWLHPKRATTTTYCVTVTSKLRRDRMPKERLYRVNVEVWLNDDDHVVHSVGVFGSFDLALRRGRRKADALEQRAREVERDIRAFHAFVKRKAKNPKA